MAYQTKKSRNELLGTFKSLLGGSIGTAVEIGTYQAEFANQIISHTKPDQFYAVDPYQYFPSEEDRTGNPGPEFQSQDRLDKLALRIAETLANKSTPAELIREPSVTAAAKFADGSLDFVYIDGDHSYAGVTEDILAWYPKLRTGGVLAGHDYCPGNPQRGHVYGVIQAVDEFAEKNGYSNLTTNTEPYATWFIQKGNKTDKLVD